MYPCLRTNLGLGLFSYVNSTISIFRIWSWDTPEKTRFSMKDANSVTWLSSTFAKLDMLGTIRSDDSVWDIINHFSCIRKLYYTLLLKTNVILCMNEGEWCKLFILSFKSLRSERVCFSHGMRPDLMEKKAIFLREQHASHPVLTYVERTVLKLTIIFNYYVI